MVLVFINFYSTNFSFGQTVTAIVDRDKILIGEQINLLLKTDNIQAVTQWFNLPDTVSHLEVVKRSKIDTIDIAGNTIYQQNIVITSFDSGHWQLPALTLVGGNNANFTTPPIELDVLPVDVTQLQDYHDIKDIVEVQQQTSYLSIILIALITLVSLIAVILLMRKKRAVAIKAPQLTGNLSPLEWARQELNKLKTENLFAQNRAKQHYQQLTDITRQFFHLQLRHKSLHQTTDEWMVHLQSLPVSPDTKTSFLQLLRLADTVKFAKYQPPAFENEQSIPVALQMVERVAAETDRVHPNHKKS
ncbi:MAG: hypothetical protein LH478_09050 [Chitinophagaceae bacterium]|nr:hypothetical protein [Chitinophagaceae bacterium]